MSTPRVRRLLSDFQKLKELDSRSPFVRIHATEGEPPEKYVLHLRCKGISKLDSESNPVYADTFLLSIQLHHDYPSKAPQFEILADKTPIFQPNIGAGGLVCIGDAGDHGWSPALSLDDVVMRIIMMIRYENVGYESPLNMLAHAWAEKNTHLFPLETSQIITDEELVITLDEADLDNVLDDVVAEVVNEVPDEDDLLQDIVIY